MSDEVADRLTRNTYRVLMTRGMRGVLLSSTDPETQAFLAARMHAGAWSFTGSGGWGLTTGGPCSWRYPDRLGRPFGHWHTVTATRCGAGLGRRVSGGNRMPKEARVLGSGV
ncbi:DNA/RNA helicase domain-containing protein [Micromonospora antibiotica]|nr:DNA/RNA helicase domain-containing protein [Micromonospora antibiotica]